MAQINLKKQNCFLYAPKSDSQKGFISWPNNTFNFNIIGMIKKWHILSKSYIANFTLSVGYKHYLFIVFFNFIDKMFFYELNVQEEKYALFMKYQKDLSKFEKVVRQLSIFKFLLHKLHIIKIGILIKQRVYSNFIIQTL